MSEYRATTADIREAIYGQLPLNIRAEAEPTFDRWLAWVKADAWDEGRASGVRHPYITEVNPYRGEQAPTEELSCNACHECIEEPFGYVLCPTCGNKRCPKASDHNHECSGSNEPGQVGSIYGFTADRGEQA